MAKRSVWWGVTDVASAQLSANVLTSGRAPFTFGTRKIDSVKFGHGANATEIFVGLRKVTT